MIFTEKTSRIAHFCHAKGRHAPNFAEKTFAYTLKTAKFAKVFSLKSFPLYGRQLLRMCSSKVVAACIFNELQAVCLFLASDGASTCADHFTSGKKYQFSK